MKKLSLRVLAIVLCFTLAFTIATPAFAGASDAYEYTEEELALEKKGQFISNLLEFLLNDLIIGVIARLIPNLAFVTDYADKTASPDFYLGNTSFLEAGSGNYTWNVGYAKRSIIPDDFPNFLKYARGSYAPWGYSFGFYKDDDGNDEDMNVRTVVLDDNTGRGVHVLCSVDCIGISNTDVRKIREAIADFAAENNIISINVSSIHSHQAIDSQGVWNNPLATIITNVGTYYGTDEPVYRYGVNEDYLNKIISSTKESVEAAFDDMKAGKLTYTDIELDGFMGARTVSEKCDGNMHRICFYPDDGSRGTLIASFGAHPEMTSYGAEFTGDLSADFVYYMDKLVSKAGMNFMYIQGNVGTNSVQTGASNDGFEFENNHDKMIRYAYEMAYIALGANMTYDERAALNDELGDVLGVAQYKDNEDYTVWYEDLATFEEEPIEAFLNVRMKEVDLVIENTTALTLMKLGLASNAIAYNKEDHQYYTTTEIGIMEFGDTVTAFLSPGEMYSELYVGGYGLRYSDYNSLREDYGEDVILFDLMNDAAGYICPEETYTVYGYKYSPSSGELEEDSWCLLVSIGKPTATVLMREYANLVAEVA